MQLTSRRASRPDERFSRESDVRGHELQTLTTEGDEEGDGHEYIADAAASSVARNCFAFLGGFAVIAPPELTIATEKSIDSTR